MRHFASGASRQRVLNLKNSKKPLKSYIFFLKNAENFIGAYSIFRIFVWYRKYNRFDAISSYSI